MPRRADEGRRDGPRPLRAFFALELSEAARRAAAGLARALQGAPNGDHVRWVRPENLHVTLRFLGSVAPERVPELVAHARAETAGIPPCEVSLGAFSWLGRKVAILDVGPVEPLAALAAATERAAVAAGFEPETRPFRPHLTLGRVRRRPLPAVTSAVTVPPETFRVQEVVLFQSRLRPQGATYTPLERVELSRSPQLPENTER